MNCRNHPDLPAAAFCRECGKPLCADCQRPALGTIYCAEHVPVKASAAPASGSAEEPAPPSSGGGFAGSRYTTGAASSDEPPSPYTAPVPPTPRISAPCHTHPGLALLLGFIPGVGAIYNGQYAKGLIHAVIFGVLISITARPANDLEPLFGILIATWVFYMAFEAFHTAMKRRRGEEADEFSSIIDVRPAHGRFPAGAVLLIVIGFVLLLDTTDLINIEQLERYWPLGLILLGVYMLYARVTDRHVDARRRDAEARR